MKIVFYSSIFFTDCDFSLIREYQLKNVEVTYFIQVVSGRQCGGLLDLRSYNLPPGIYPANQFPELMVYDGFFDLANIFLVWRIPNFTSLENWKTYYKLISKIRQIKPKVVHISGELGLSESLLYLFRRKIVQTVHDPFMHSGEKNKLAEVKRKISFKLSKKLILLNENQKQKFLEVYNVTKHHVFVNRLGVYQALNYLSLNQKNENAVLPNKYVLFFGHISPYKGIDDLCKAMLKVHEKMPELKCIIAGKGKLYFDYKPFEKLDYILLKNEFISTDDLVNLIEKSMFTICPYKDATQSGVVASSFAMAKPVLATNVGGLGETVVDNVTGCLIPPNNVELLAKSICEMAMHESMLAKFSDNIKHLFWEGKNSWGTIADKYIQIYEQYKD